MDNIRQSFKYPEITGDHYVFGSTQLEANILRPDRDWRRYTPPGELQRRYGVESSACFIEAQQHVIATILEEQYDLPDQNFSARFNMIFTESTPSGGDPLQGANSFRKNGLIPDSMLPFAPYITEWAQFKSFNGANMADCLVEGQKWLNKYDPHYDIVIKKEYDLGIKYERLKDALHFSPIAVSIYGKVDASGNYVPKPAGVSDTHLVELVYIDDNNVPTIFDTYEPFVKQLPANYNFDFGLRWTIDNTPEKLSLIALIINKIKELMDKLTPRPNTQPEPVLPQLEPSVSMLDKFCLAIQEREGYFKGSRSYRNCNPGNVKYSPVGYAPIYGVVRKDVDNFAIFKDYETGYLYLKNFIKSKASKNPQQTIRQFISVYAPASDNNNEVAYADFIGNKLGVDENTYTLAQVVV